VKRVPKVVAALIITTATICFIFILLGIMLFDGYMGQIMCPFITKETNLTEFQFTGQQV
jgi:hypothetical protein